MKASCSRFLAERKLKSVVGYGVKGLDQFTIGTLAKQAGTNVETVRYYQSRGLVDEPRRPPGGVRLYTQAHVRRLRFIKQAKTLGFRLDEVIDLLALEDGKHCRQAERMGARKLEIVRERIAQLRQVEMALATLVDQCQCNTGKVHCPLIDALETESAVDLVGRRSTPP